MATPPKACLNYLMQTAQILLVRKSFTAVERHAEISALVFYRRLFELAPQVRPMFKTDIHEQSKKLMDMLAAALNLLERPAELVGELEQMGARHAGYGTRPEHYAVVRRALLDMLGEVMGTSFTPETRAAWDELYDAIEAAMLRGAAAAAGGQTENTGLQRPKS